MYNNRYLLHDNRLFSIYKIQYELKYYINFSAEILILNIKLKYFSHSKSALLPGSFPYMHTPTASLSHTKLSGCLFTSQSALHYRGYPIRAIIISLPPLRQFTPLPDKSPFLKTEFLLARYLEFVVPPNLLCWKD